MLHPNRLGPNGNVELGGMHEPPAAGTWVKNWTSQFKSPVGEFVPPIHLFFAYADFPQMSCNYLLTDPFIPFLFTFVFIEDFNQ